IIRQTSIFIIMGVFVLFLAYYFLPTDKRPEFASTAIMNIAFVLIAVGILNIFWWLAGGDPISAMLKDSSDKIRESFTLLEEGHKTGVDTLNELRHSLRLVEDSRLTGLRRILTVSRDFELRGGDWMQRLASAQRNVDLMGFS